MKQILQNLSNGETTIADIPVPAVQPGCLLIATKTTLVSAGTERMLVEFGKANLVDKARQQPDKVRMVLEKIKTDGLLPTVDAVRSKLDQPIALGYCNAGVVIDIGEGVEGYKIGDRVASNGKHAEVVSVPVNLCAKIPDNVDADAASFTVIGAIALQGIRLLAPTLGETIVVTGLGLIGLITVQLLRAQGCRVIGIDFDETKLELARGYGAETVNLSAGEDPVNVAVSYSRGRGVDGVVITASTSSNEPVSQAAKMCRKRGRIILVGVTGLNLSRADFFEKELTFQVSCSYGPGRYDSEYEEYGRDYPVGYVRWTEQRNFEAVLDMLSQQSLSIKDLVSHRFDIHKAEKAYKELSSGHDSLGMLIHYPVKDELPNKARVVELNNKAGESASYDAVNIGFIGAGNYAGRVLIPGFVGAGVELNNVVTSAGVSGAHYGKKYGFKRTSTNVESVIADESINTVVIATRHDSHAKYVCQAIENGKFVFVEKPLALTLSELDQIQSSISAASEAGVYRGLMVGFNRRFSPQVKKMKKLLDTLSEPKSFVMTVNAGDIPQDHWTQDMCIGGGRIIGEACHFIDLLRFLSDSEITSWNIMAIGDVPGVSVRSDKVSFTLSFADGSFGTVHYLANGSKAFPKERLEVFCSGKILQLDNFRKLTGYGWPGFKKYNLWRQDKGQAACVSEFVAAIKQRGSQPIPLEELFEVSRVSIELANAV